MCHRFTPTFHTIKELLHAVIFLIPALTNTSPQRHYVISYAWFSPWIISRLTNSIIFKSMVLLWVLKWLLLLLTFFLVCSKPTLSLTPLGSLPQVSQVTTAKSLGVTIDDRLDLSGHIEKVTKESRFWYWGHKTNKAPCPSGDLTTNISSFNTATLWLLPHCLGKLWDNLTE